MAVSQEIQEQMLKEAYSVTPNYDIDYNDPRFSKVETDKNDALNELEKTYSGMLDKAGGFYQNQIDALDKWEEEQTRIQNEQTDFAIEQINQQKDKAHKDYLKEQSASYVDWQKQSNQYGANAEQMASAGLTGTGFSESSQVAMYTAYQNRVAVARESYNNAVLNYNNSIKDAQLQNSAALAQIAFETLQKQLELSLEGFQYQNQLLLDKADKKTQLDNTYYARYQDVLEQINKENVMAEDIRQYNETMKWNTEQKELDREHDKTMAEVNFGYDKQLADINHKYQVERDNATRKFQEDQAKLDREHDLAMVAANTTAAKERADHEHKLASQRLALQHQNDLDRLEAELINEKALLDHKNSLERQSYGNLGDNNTGNNGRSKIGSFVSNLIDTVKDKQKPYTPSASVQKKIKSLSLMRNQSGSKKAIANSICVYLYQKQITSKDAEYMLKYFGYDPDDYLD